jgi:hypothetical protein
MPRTLKALPLVVAAAALALAGYICLRQRQIQATQEQPFGRYTARQIVDQTLPLCRTLQPEADRFALSIEHTLGTDPRGKPWRFWDVEYTDKTGAYLAKFTWDAQTGELDWVSHRISEVLARPPAFASHTRPWTEGQTRARAAWLGYRWLCRLGFAEAGSRWRLTKAPEPTPGTDAWFTLWRSGERVVFVNVNVISGELVYAQRCYPSALLPVR